jgi:hypothetical protein
MHIELVYDTLSIVGSDIGIPNGSTKEGTRVY